MKEIDINKQDVAAAIEQDSWIVPLAEKHCTGVGLDLDDIFKVNLYFICKHWSLKPYEIDYWLFKRVLHMVYKTEGIRK